MPRRGSFKQWNSRLSAGGANRTNIRGQMSRVSDPDVNLPHHSNSFDLLPAPRQSSFHPWNSRLTARPRSPQASVRYWEPNLPHHRPSADEWIPPREKSPDILLDEKGRPVPRKGMFLNAKYSKPVRPVPDEEQIRRTEEMIRRIVHPQRRDQRSEYMTDYGMNCIVSSVVKTNCLCLRDRIRQVVYDMGVPPDYRAPTRHSSHEYEQYPVNFEGRAHSSQRDAYRHIEDRDEAERKRLPSSRQQVESEEDDDDASGRDSPNERRGRHRKEKSSLSDRRQLRKTDRQVGRESRAEKERETIHESKNRKRQSAPRDEAIGEECPNKRLNTSHKSTAQQKDDPNCSRGSRASRVCTPKEMTPSPKYIRDPDEVDNWKNGLSFMSKPSGAGTEMFARIGSAIPSIPLKDNTQNSYSKVAHMLLSRSIKNSKLNEKHDEKRKEKLQTQLMNMSTSWVRTMNGQQTDGGKRDSGRTIIDEVSKIQNPQNATKIQMSESLFMNSKLFDPVVSGDREKTRKFGQPRTMPPPLFHSSPVSNDVFRSDEGITMPSSIRKSGQTARVQYDSDEEEPMSKAQDVDDYIAQGASQINFSREIESRSSSLKQTTPSVSSSIPRPEFMGQQSNSLNESKKSSAISEGSPMKTKEIDEQEKKNLTAVSSKSKNEGYTLQLNSQFLFSAKKKKKTGSQPVLDFDAETQKMFDAVFDNEADTSAFRKKQREKYSF